MNIRQSCQMCPSPGIGFGFRPRASILVIQSPDAHADLVELGIINAACCHDDPRCCGTCVFVCMSCWRNYMGYSGIESFCLSCDDAIDICDCVNIH